MLLDTLGKNQCSPSRETKSKEKRRNGGHNVEKKQSKESQRKIKMERRGTAEAILFHHVAEEELKDRKKDELPKLFGRKDGVVNLEILLRVMLKRCSDK